MGNFFVRRPIVAIVIAIITTIVGTLSIKGLPMEQYPNITPPIVNVRATYTGANILMIMALTDETGEYDQTFLNNYALINIKDVLSRIKGIGRVDVIGASDYSMRIWIKPDRLAQMDISVPEIIDAIRAQNIIVPGGKFGAEPAPAGNRGDLYHFPPQCSPKIY